MIICEVGLNHLGREDYSTRYVDVLDETLCDAITYQVREKEFYERDKYKGYDLSFKHYNSIQQLTTKQFGIALANHDLVEECESVGVDFYKTLSWDLNNYDFIDKLLATGKSIHVSTGTSTMDDLIEFHKRYGKNKQLNLIHTQLTKDVMDANITCITMLKEMFPYGIGYGNHSANMNVIFGAVALRPEHLWIYVRGSKNTWRFHPDEFWALPLDDVDTFIRNIRLVEQSLGNGLKKSTNTKGY